MVSLEETGYHLPSRAAFEARVTPRTRALLYATPGLGRDEIRIAYVIERERLERGTT